MRLAIIQGGVVRNVACAAEGTTWEPGPGLIAVASEVAQIGWLWDGQDFAPAESETLAQVQARRYAEIDARTDEIIEAGFEFPPASGQRFELSLEAQSRMNALLVLATNPLMEYPIVWNLIDDSGSIALNDAATAQALCLTAVGTIRAVLDSGSTLKTQVRGAATIGAAVAVADTR